MGDVQEFINEMNTLEQRKLFKGVIRNYMK